MRAALLAIVGTALATTAASAQVTIVNNVPGVFIDISGSGTSLGANGSDDSLFNVPAAHGNPILAAGNLSASSNGRVTVPGSAAFSNSALSGTSEAGYYPFWDDLEFFSAGSGDMFYQNLADRTIIQWNNVHGFAGSPNTGTFQIQIFSSSTIAAQYIYQSVDFGDSHANGASATIGAVMDGAAPRSFAQWSFNTASIQSGSVLTVLVPAPGAAALLGLGGLVAIRRRR